MVYDQARWYDPATGQFMSQDPEVDQTLQPYAYAGDDPTNYADPEGLRATRRHPKHFCPYGYWDAKHHHCVQDRCPTPKIHCAWVNTVDYGPGHTNQPAYGTCDVLCNLGIGYVLGEVAGARVVEIISRLLRGIPFSVVTAVAKEIIQGWPCDHICHFLTDSHPHVRIRTHHKCWMGRQPPFHIGWTYP